METLCSLAPTGTGAPIPTLSHSGLILLVICTWAALGSTGPQPVAAALPRDQLQGLGPPGVWGCESPCVPCLMCSCLLSPHSCLAHQISPHCPAVLVSGTHWSLGTCPLQEERKSGNTLFLMNKLILRELYKAGLWGAQPFSSLSQGHN